MPVEVLPRIIHPRGIIQFIDGDVSVDIGNKIIAIDIIFKGKFELENYDLPNWLFLASSNRIIGVSLDSTPLGENPFLKYTGKFNVLDCTVVRTDNKSQKLQPIGKIKDRILYRQTAVDKDTASFDELDNYDNVVGKLPRKSKIYFITKNLETKGNEYTLNRKPYIGQYHLYKDGTAMTGPDYTNQSENLEIRNKARRKQKSVKVTQRLNINKIRKGTTMSKGGY